MQRWLDSLSVPDRWGRISGGVLSLDWTVVRPEETHTEMGLLFPEEMKGGLWPVMSHTCSRPSLPEQQAEAGV